MLTDLLEKIKKLDFSLAERPSELRPLAQMLKKLRIMRRSEDVMISLRGANERLRHTAIRKFGYKKANMIWLLDKHLPWNR